MGVKIGVIGEGMRMVKSLDILAVNLRYFICCRHLSPFLKFIQFCVYIYRVLRQYSKILLQGVLCRTISATTQTSTA